MGTNTRLIAGLRQGLEPRGTLAILIGALLAFLVAYPLIQLALHSFITNGAPSVDNYVRALGERRSYIALGNSLYLGISTTFFALLLGTGIAWLLVRTDLPLKGTVRALVLLTLISPTYIGAIAWLQLLGRAGYINRFLMRMLHLSTPPIDIYSLGGVILVMTLHLYPLVFFIVANALVITDPGLEEAAALSGAPPPRVLRTVTLPLLLPSLLSAAVLVFLRAISAFGVPAIFGLPTGHYVLTTRIYAALNSYDLGLATALSILLLGLCGLVLMFNGMLLGQRKRYITTTTGSRNPKPASLGRWHTPILVALLTFFGFTTILPLLTILASSFLKAWGLPLTGGNLTLANYAAVLFKERLTMRALGNGFLFSGIAASVAVLLGFLVAYISIRTRFPGREALNGLATLPFAVPGPVLAIALILAFMDRPIELYNTPWILIIGYIVAFMPFAVRNISGALRALDPALEEAARTSGASWPRVFKDIMLPLIKPGLLSGWILVFLFVLREIPLSVMLHTAGTETVGVVLFSLRTGGGGLEEVSALAAIVVLLTLLGSYGIERLGGRLEVGR